MAEEEQEVEEAQEELPQAVVAQPAMVAGNPGVLKIHIGEGKDINLEIPMGYAAGPVAPQEVAAPVVAQEVPAEKVQEKVELPDRKVRELVKKHYKIDKVEFGPETKIEGTTLYIRENICEDAVNADKLVVSIKVDIITPDKYNQYSETIMDVQPGTKGRQQIRTGNQGIGRCRRGIFRNG